MLLPPFLPKLIHSRFAKKVGERGYDDRCDIAWSVGYDQNHMRSHLNTEYRVSNIMVLEIFAWQAAMEYLIGRSWRNALPFTS